MTHYQPDSTLMAHVRRVIVTSAQKALWERYLAALKAKELGIATPEQLALVSQVQASIAAGKN